LDADAIRFGFDSISVPQLLLLTPLNTSQKDKHVGADTWIPAIDLKFNNILTL
jgi:hypothetical protein